MHAETPWFRQFWPWFLLALPLAVVITGFATLYIAVRHADSPVRDDYAKQGLVLRREHGQDQAAARLGLGARLALDAHRHAGGAVSLTLAGALDEAPATLELRFIHPADETNDFIVPLARDGDRYTGTLPQDALGHWTVELHAPASSWRLRGALAAGVTLLGAATAPTPP